MKFARKAIVVAVSASMSSAYMSSAHADEEHEDDHLHSDHHYHEEIVVSAPFNQREADTALPVNILSGEQLAREVEDTLGGTLKNQLGIHNTSFGPSVGQAVIRGQSGNRVQVLQNSVNNIDVSAVSPDHVNGLEPALATKIEVLRGPSTLLYGNGAIGGIVNVLDNRIPESSFEQPEFVIEQSHNTVNEENKTVARFNASFGGLNLHFDGFTRDNDDVEIDGFAIDEAALELLEHDHHEDEHEGEEHHDDDEHHDEHEGEDHDEHDDHDDEEIMNTDGFISNSDAESEGYTFGASFSGDQGFFGFSVSEIENNYGLPGGSHNHDHGEEHDEDHDEDHDDEHEGEGHDEDHDEDHEHGEEEGQEFVRLDMEQTRYDMKGELRFDSGFVQSIRGSVNYTDYEHQEIEIEGDGTAFVGTSFSNEGYEGRFTMTHAPINNWQGVWGVQFSETEFSALGEEAFIPETDTSGYALFLVERLELENITWELGYRHEFLETDAGAGCDRDESTNSLSASVIYDMNEESNLLIAASRSERAPTLEERFSNVQTGGCAPSADPEDWTVHVATGLLEIGNPDLDKEVATNIEVGFHTHGDHLEGEFNVYYNQIDDYIYLADGGEFEETPIGLYSAEDAVFYGMEGRVVYHALENEHGSLDLSVQGDMVRAEFDDAGDVPRIPADRIGVGATWHASSWTVSANLTEVMDQEQAAVGEFDTEGYTLLDIYADYHIELGQGELLVFAKGTNLLDEEIRNHTSFLKNFAPEPGRGVRLGLRFTY